MGCPAGAVGFRYADDGGYIYPRAPGLPSEVKVLRVGARRGLTTEPEDMGRSEP